MLLRYINSLSNYGKCVQNNLPALFRGTNDPNNFTQVRYIKKHWNPKFKKLRTAKVIKVKLPTFDDKADVDDPTNLEKEEVRSRLKEHGFLPQKAWKERPIYISCTPSVIEPYVAPEGDGKFSIITKEGAKQKFTFFEKKSKSYMAMRKVKTFDDTFTPSTFVDEALDIYKLAHEALAAKDKEKLIRYVTENAYAKMTHNLFDKTIHWKFLESLEPGRIVHARNADILKKENIFVQLTIRFHTQQILAVYDRFGRLIQGSEILRKDVLEYIVFERHMSHEYGTWRIHDKIIPSWMAPKDVAEGTYVLPQKKPDPEPTNPAPVETVLVKDTPKDAPKDASQDVATA